MLKIYRILIANLIIFQNLTHGEIHEQQYQRKCNQVFEVKYLEQMPTFFSLPFKEL
jgi:hypothetical protein